MAIAGYLINHPEGLRGTRGSGYDYVLARNGVFIETPQHPHLRVRHRVAGMTFPGLADLQESFHLVHGRIPAPCWTLGLNELIRAAPQERFVSVVWDGGEYRLLVPEQETTGASVKYTPQPDTVFEMHSHGRMSAFFSGTDDRDEQGLAIYGVAGRINGTIPSPPALRAPEFRLRLGVYGRFRPVKWTDVFAGDGPRAWEGSDEKAEPQAGAPENVIDRIVAALRAAADMIEEAAQPEEEHGNTDSDPDSD